MNEEDLKNQLDRCNKEIESLKKYHKERPDDVGSLYGLRDWQLEKNIIFKKLDKNSGKHQPFEYDPT